MFKRPSHSKQRKLVRTFIAANIASSVRKALTAAIDEVRSKTYGVNIRWLPEDSWHLTVKFLGDVDWLQTGTIGSALKDVAGTIEPFELEISGLMAFPPNRSPRIVAAGMGLGHDKLTALHTAIDSRLRELGAEPERRSFKAHLTLGRIKGSAGSESLLDDLAPFADLSFGVMLVDEVDLYQSEFFRKGAMYTSLARAPLGS